MMMMMVVMVFQYCFKGFSYCLFILHQKKCETANQKERKPKEKKIQKVNQETLPSFTLHASEVLLDTKSSHL